MTPEEAIKLLDEKTMIFPARCNGKTKAISDARELAVKALEKQVPKKPYQDNENGVHEKDYCPTCHRSLFPYDHHCRCGQAIDWTDWEK